MSDRYVKSVVREMLRENTGTHFLDSGSAYGRNWQRNQGRKFGKEPAVIVDADEEHDSILLAYNIYWYLVNMLMKDKDTAALERMFSKYLDEHPDDSWLGAMDGFLDGLKLDDDWGTANTYNRDHLLTQELQYRMFGYRGESYVMVSVHGGCDVRGGYARPRIFKTDHDYFILAQVDVNAFCVQCENSWYSDCSGYHFYPSNGEPAYDKTCMVRDGKVFCKCGGRIEYSVTEGW